jgi:hypothetical protein
LPGTGHDGRVRRVDRRFGSVSDSCQASGEHQFAAQVSGLASLGFGDDWLRNVPWSNGLRLFGLESAA